jgi:hypothetical protein
MFTAIIAFVQAIPSLVHGVEVFTKTYYDAKVKITTARIGGDTEVAKAIVSGVQMEGQTRVEFLRVVSQSKFLMFLLGGFALPWMVHEWKIVIWDNMLGLGVTKPIGGTVGEWGGVIIASIFGSSTAAAIGQMYFNRKER